MQLFTWADRDGVKWMFTTRIFPGGLLEFWGPTSFDDPPVVYTFAINKSDLEQIEELIGDDKTINLEEINERIDFLLGGRDRKDDPNFDYYRYVRLPSTRDN
jgi:hypothetical protein